MNQATPPSAPLGVAAIGIVSPLGSGREAVAVALLAGSRDGLIADAACVPGKTIRVGALRGELPPLAPAFAADACRNNQAMAAALRQIEDDVARVAAQYGRHRIAVVLGSSTGGIAEGEAAYDTVRRSGAWPHAFQYRQQEVGGLARFAAHFLGLSGPAYSVATACSSSGKAFASARRLIRLGVCDAAIVGGADTLCGMTANGFSALEAVSPGFCNPFSRNRDGINIGEAAAAFLLTREAAEINLLGMGESSDAHHVSAPDPSGQGAYEAMRLALADAGLAPADIGYINLHGTATPLNDVMEGKAVHQLFGETTPCSSTKSMTGHTLGAASACEAAFLWLSLHPAYNDGRLPPHLWDGEQDPAIPSLNLVAGDMWVPAGKRAMLSNSFAFGGSNFALILGQGG